MRWTMLVLTASSVACGGKIAGIDDVEPDAALAAADAASDARDATSPKFDGSPPQGTVPLGTFCYEGAATSGVSCKANPANGSGGSCQTSLDCEGHVFRAVCTDGLCQCINEGYGQCYCFARSTNACGNDGNCCWRP